MSWSRFMGVFIFISNMATNVSTATGIALSLVFLKIVGDLTRRHIDGRAYSAF